jgi:hypothetical protein
MSMRVHHKCYFYDPDYGDDNRVLILIPLIIFIDFQKSHSVSQAKNHVKIAKFPVLMRYPDSSSLPVDKSTL